MAFNPPTDPRYAAYFNQCTVELTATKWDEVAKFDKLGVLGRPVCAATMQPRPSITAIRTPAEVTRQALKAAAI